MHTKSGIAKKMAPPLPEDGAKSFHRMSRHALEEQVSVTSGGREEWRWTFTMSVGPPGFGVHGGADTKAEAVALLEVTWETLVGLSESGRC